jgi:glycosyltransferase involved in cell wall biosynthesis
VSIVALVGWAKVRRASIIWTVHNVDNHDSRRPALSRAARRVLVSGVDGVHYLSEAARQESEARWPSLRRRAVAVTLHGDYREVASTTPQADARQRFGIGAEDRLICFVGKVRPYKGLDDLVVAFAGVTDPAARLLIAGELSPEVGTWGVDDGRVTTVLRRLTQDEIDAAICAADVVVLPYRRVSSSGAAVLALTLDRPVLVPAMGAMPELARAVGDGWVMTYDGPITSATLERALQDAGATVGGTPDLSALDWRGIGASLARLVDAVTDRRSAGPR